MTAQQPVSPSRPDNLFATVPGSFRAPGNFDARAKTTSIQTFFSLHRVVIGACVLGAAAVMLAAGAKRS